MMGVTLLLSDRIASNPGIFGVTDRRVVDETASLAETGVRPPPRQETTQLQLFFSDILLL